MFAKSYKSIVEINIINFLLSFFFLGYCFNTFSLLKKVMVKVSFEHQIIRIKLLKLFYEVLLFHNKFNHLHSDHLSDLFYHSFKCYLRILLTHFFVYFFQEDILRNRWDFIGTFEDFNTFSNKQDFSCSLDLYESVWNHKLFECEHVPISNFDMTTCFGFKFILLRCLG